MLSKDRKHYAIQAVENALCLLESISTESGDFGVSHLSSKLNMNKSYIFRLLATFERRGYVQYFEETGRYQAGLTAYETGGRFLHRMELLQKAKPIMESLAKETGETVYLAIPGGGGCVVVRDGRVFTAGAGHPTGWHAFLAPEIFGREGDPCFSRTNGKALWPPEGHSR